MVRQHPGHGAVPAQGRAQQVCRAERGDRELHTDPRGAAWAEASRVRGGRSAHGGSGESQALRSLSSASGVLPVRAVCGNGESRRQKGFA